MATWWWQTVCTIISSTLENGCDEMKAPVCVATEREWGDVGRGEVRDIEHSVSDDSGVMGGNDGHHHFQNPQKWEW